MRQRVGSFEGLTKKAYSPHEAAYVLGLGRTKLYQLLKEGAISHLRVGKRILITDEALTAWLRSQEKSQGGSA